MAAPTYAIEDTSMRATFTILLLIAGLGVPYSVNAMTCFDMRQPPPFHAFQIDEQTGHSFQVANPMNQGLSYRDPTGQFYMRLPAQQPQMEAYFAAWNGQLILLNAHAPGPMVIGHCQHQASMPQPIAYALPVLSGQYQVIGAGAGTPNIPSQFLPTGPSYAVPAYAHQSELQACMSTGAPQSPEFLDCAIGKLFNSRQAEVYECTKANDVSTRTQCIASKMLGSREQQVIALAQQCQQQTGGDWQMMPLCLGNLQFDQQTQKTIGCLQDHAMSGNESAWALAACIGGSQVNMNPEMTVAVQCAMASGGEPLTWAGCTGGQLTATELEKCITHGVGGPTGCFGPNNTIVQGLNQLGNSLSQAFGPNNDIVRTFNNAVSDVTHGPGPNNTLVQVANTVVNDLTHGPGENNDIRRAVNSILPGIW